MQTRESGMPTEEAWQGFFDVQVMLKMLEMTENCGDVLEFGCGCGASLRTGRVLNLSSRLPRRPREIILGASDELLARGSRPFLSPDSSSFACRRQFRPR